MTSSRPQTLRDLPKSNRQFWQAGAKEQLAQTVIDQNADYVKRVLSDNEVATLPMNEIAVQNSRGFFFHLPSRSSWSPTAGERQPVERTPRLPGPNYPTMLYMDFNWTSLARSNYLDDKHRGRYLRSSALGNAPPADTPLFAMQYAFQKCPVFVTAKPSLVIFATAQGYYLATTAQLQPILGLDRTDRSKLGSANWLWDRAALDKGKDNRKVKDAAMERFKQQDLEAVYNAILSYRREGLTETFSASELHQVMPRPSGGMAQIGQALGRGDSAEPATRRGCPHAFAPRGKRLKLLDTQPDSTADHAPDQDHQGDI